jgi:hemolysin III
MEFLKMREPTNTWTHFITFLVAIVGLGFLIALSYKNVSTLVTMSIYGISVILLYGASSIYHWLHTTSQNELILKKLDHCAIYLLIAGSYTPVLYYGLDGSWCWSMLGAIWGLTVIGILMKVWFIRIPRYISTLFYVILGWIAVIPFAKLLHKLPIGAIILMSVGGALYTIGAIIYATKWLDFSPNRFGFHEIFHFFVMAGSGVHYAMMVVYIIPLGLQG